MRTQVADKPAFAHIAIELEPGESLMVEADAMSHMDAAVSLSTGFNGGFFKGLARKFLGGESLFINTFANHSRQTLRLHLSQALPGDIVELDLQPGQTFGLSQGAYIASEKSVTVGTAWAGFGSFIAREGLFKLTVTGPGKVWFGSYGGVIPVQIEGEQLIDTSHLVAWEPALKIKIQLSGGLISSLTSGEGLVSRVEGRGLVYIQSRNIDALARWVNSKI